jgi:hypothetical protein
MPYSLTTCGRRFYFPSGGRRATDFHRLKYPVIVSYSASVGDIGTIHSYSCNYIKNKENYIRPSQGFHNKSVPNSVLFYSVFTIIHLRPVHTYRIYLRIRTICVCTRLMWEEIIRLCSPTRLYSWFVGKCFTHQREVPGIDSLLRIRGSSHTSREYSPLFGYVRGAACLQSVQAPEL